MSEYIEIHIKRGLESNLMEIVPKEDEPMWTTDTKKLYIGDGVTQGGIYLCNLSSHILKIYQNHQVPDSMFTTVIKYFKKLLSKQY